MAELHKRGVFAVLVCSTPFEGLGRMQAARLDAAELPLIVIQHPLGGLSLEKVRERAEALGAACLDLLERTMR